MLKGGSWGGTGLLVRGGGALALEGLEGEDERDHSRRNRRRGEADHLRA